MNRTTKILLAIGIIVLSYPGLAWLTGIAVQGRLQRSQQQVLERVPYVALLKREYDRGIYRSTEIATYGLRIPAAGAAIPAGATLTITSHIQHGPLPGLSAIGLATVDSTVSGPPAMQKALAAVLGTTPLMRVHTTVGLFGGATANITSPAFSTQLPDGSTLTWGGVTGTVTSGGIRARDSVQLSVPRLALKGSHGAFEIAGIEYSGSFRKAFDELYLGSGTLTIERLDGTTAPRSAFSLQRISLATASKADGQFLDMRVDLAMDAAQAAAVQLTNVVYSVSVEHLHGPTLASMTQAIRKAEGEAGPDPVKLQAAAQGAFRQYGVELLLHDPVIDIRRISFTMPEGTFLVSAKVSAPGLSPADLQGLPAASAALKTHAELTADVSVDNGLVQKFLALKRATPNVGQQLTTFEQQGYLTAGTSAVTTHVAYAAGKLTLNGHPFPPAPPAPPPP